MREEGGEGAWGSGRLFVKSNSFAFASIILVITALKETSFDPLNNYYVGYQCN